MERRVIELRVAGFTQRQICKKLKKGDRKVRQILEKAEAFGYLTGTPLPVAPLAVFPEPPPAAVISASDVDELLMKYRTWIEERLVIGWSKVTVWEELPMQVGRSSFYRFLERHKLHRIGERGTSRLTPEIVHQPGEALIVDWGKLRSVRGEDGKSKTLWAFVGVLGFSRYMMVRLVWTNDVPTTVTVLESMLKEIGGVPKRITSDNPKCFALEASKYEPLLNPVLERWSAHYGLCLECLPPADPKKKGKVERTMPYVRRLYEAHGDVWHGIEESQTYIDKKLAIANERRHGTTNLRPVDVFTEMEKQELKLLPALAFEVEEFHEGEVRNDGYVRFRNKFYSVGEEFKGRHAVVLGGKTQVSIYLDGKLVEVHERITSPHVSKSTKSHHLKPHERVMQDGAFYKPKHLLGKMGCSQILN
ncbi:MAG: IS21 family transposase [Bdellovibrionales bacterium]